MSTGRVIVAIPVVLGLAWLVWSGTWQAVPLFLWQHPMLSWLPLLAFAAIGVLAGSLMRLSREVREPSLATGGGSEAAEPVHAGPIEAGPERRAVGLRMAFAPGPALLAGLAVFLVGLFFTVISPPGVGLEDIDYELVDALPERTQPRLLPRTGVRDDPSFREAKEIHLARDPETGDLMWTGEWQAATFGGPSAGVSVKRLDEVSSESEIVRAGFDRSVSAMGMGTLKWKAKLKHPFSRIQYPVLVPTGEREAVAVAPYVGYRGFPFRRPYLKGVLVYHQDGTLEDLTPEEAAARPELVRSGRIVPETVARKQAEALAKSDELDGKIVDGKGNRQPFLTAIDRDRTVWVTVINEHGRAGGVKAIVLADSSTGETEVWRADGERRLISTRDVLDEARALPLRWSERRCCDSDGHSYTVRLREVVEPRLAFKDGRPYYMVTVVPTRELAIGREVEYTLLIDAESGEKLDEFRHTAGGSEDSRLEAFFR